MNRRVYGSFFLGGVEACQIDSYESSRVARDWKLDAARLASLIENPDPENDWFLKRDTCTFDSYYHKNDMARARKRLDEGYAILATKTTNEVPFVGADDMGWVTAGGWNDGSYYFSGRQERIAGPREVLFEIWPSDNLEATPLVFGGLYDNDPMEICINMIERPSMHPSDSDPDPSRPVFPEPDCAEGYFPGHPEAPEERGPGCDE
jgi:hypothetical protein